MQVLEHEQHGCGSGAPGEQRQRVLEHPQLRAGRLPLGLPGLAERAQRLGERLVWQLGTDEIDRAAKEDLEPGAAGASRELGGEPGLADARLPGDEDGRTRPRPGCVERALELPEFACAPDEHLARAGFHFGQYRAANPAPGRALLSTQAAEDTQGLRRR